MKQGWASSRQHTQACTHTYTTYEPEVAAELPFDASNTEYYPNVSKRLLFKNKLRVSCQTKLAEMNAAKNERGNDGRVSESCR